MSKRSYFAATLLLSLGIAWAIIDLGNILDFKERIMTDSRSGTWVKVGDTQILWEDYVIETVAFEQLNSFHHYLLTQRESVLWGGYYILMGSLGGIVSFWLILAGIRAGADTQEDSLAPRLALSGAVGFITFLILLLPAPLFSKFFSLGLESSAKNTRPLELLDSLSALALLSGIFTSIFFERLESWFRHILKK